MIWNAMMLMWRHCNVVQSDVRYLFIHFTLSWFVLQCSPVEGRWCKCFYLTNYYLYLLSIILFFSISILCLLASFPLFTFKFDGYGFIGLCWWDNKDIFSWTFVQNGRHFIDSIFKCIFLKFHYSLFSQLIISQGWLKKSTSHNLPETMLTEVLPYGIARPWWVKCYHLTCSVPSHH